MRYLNKLATAFCASALGIFLLSSCEGGELYNVGAPDWISSKADSIKNAKGSGEEEVIVGLEEDVYTIGKTDFSTGWWAVFSKYYQVPAGKKWQAQFNLNINPNATNTYKNFALIICNDQDRGAADYKEYGAIRFDNQPSGNSEWGDYIDRSLVESTLTFATDTDAGVEKLGGKVTLTVDRSTGGFIIKMTNGTVTKTYTQSSDMPNLNTDESNTNIRFFMCPEGSFINFLGSTIEPIGGFTSAEDKQPVSLVLNNIPDEVITGTAIADAMANVTADVTFENVPEPKTVTAADLTFQAIPDMENPGEKTLIAVYNKTFKGEAATAPVIGTAKFNVVLEIESIEITKKPTYTTYYFFESPAVEGVERSFAFGTKGMEVKATYVDGSTGILNNAKLHLDYDISTMEAIYGVNVTTNNGKTAPLEIAVKKSSVKKASVSPKNLGAEDNSTGWWSVFTDDMKVPVGTTYQVDFTNYAGGSNWNNFVIILRNAAKGEYAVVRADNFGWGNGYGTALVGPGQADWAAWLAAMNGAKCTAYITNCGNGTADIQVVMNGNDGNTYYQYYSGISTVDPDDLYFSFTVDGSHLVFE